MGFGLMVEDYWNVCALIAFYTLVVLSILMVLLGGFGHHITELEHSRVMLCLKLGFAIRIMYSMALGLVKISTCVMLSRIFSMPAIKLMARILIGLTCCWIVTTVLTGFLICRPLQMVWDPFIPGGKCDNQIILFAASGIVNVVTDFFILLVPLPVVSKLKLPRASKFGLLIIFCMGILTMLFGSVRIAILFRVSRLDFTYSGKTLQIMTISEAALAIMVASSPMLRPLVDRVSPPPIISTIRNSRSSGSSGGFDDKYCQGLNTPSTCSKSLRNKSQVFEPIGDSKLTIVHIKCYEVTKNEANLRPWDDVDDGMEVV